MKTTMKVKIKGDMSKVLKGLESAFPSKTVDAVKNA